MSCSTETSLVVAEASNADVPSICSPLMTLTRMALGSEAARPRSSWSSPLPPRRRAAKPLSLNAGPASGNPNRTPSVCDSDGSLHTAQPLFLTLITCSQYTFSFCASSSNREAESRNLSAAALKFLAFHPLETWSMSRISLLLCLGGSLTSTASDLLGTACFRAGDMVSSPCCWL